MEPVRLSEAADLIVIAWVVVLMWGEDIITWWNNKDDER